MEAQNNSNLGEEEINIYLKVIKTIALKVRKSEKIKSLKAMMSEREGISEHFQELFFTGEQLVDDQKLDDYGVQNNSTLHLILQNSVPMKLFVNIPSKQKTIKVEAKIYGTIKNVKSLIQAKEGIEPDHFTLLYAGKLLEDDRTLASLEIQMESTLHLVFNPRDVLRVSVKIPSGDIVKHEVKILHTVGDFKTIIGSFVGFCVGDHDLIHGGKKLEDSKTLASYNITEDSILEILPSTFQIFIKKWSGGTVTLDVHQRDTVKYVKNKVFDKLGVPAEVHSLVFAGKSLKDDRDLGSYNIQKNSTLHVVIRPAILVRQMKLYEIECGTDIPKTTKILHLKAMIEKKMKKPVTEVFLGEKALKDHLSLDYYGIKGDTVMVVALEVR